MADFSDLWDLNGTKPKVATPNTLGSGLNSSKPGTPVQKPAVPARPYDSFSALASTASASRANYSRNNSNGSGISGVSLGAGLPSRASATPSPAPPAASSTSGDAFGSLFGSGSGGANGSSLSLAQQQAKISQQRQDTSSIRSGISANANGADQSAFWDRFESGSTARAGSNGVSKPSAAVPSRTSSPAMNSLLAPSILQPTSRPGSAAPPSSQLKSTPDDLWGDFDAFNSPVSNNDASSTVKAPAPAPSQRSRPNVTATDLFDFDEFNDSLPPTTSHSTPSAPVASSHSTSPRRSRPSSPGDFDFGDREYGNGNGDVGGLLGGGGSDEDDILGDLGRPVDQIPPKSTRPRAHTPASDTTSRKPISRAISPPPHIIGQIVEMGFSPQQARVALAATDTGLDVEAALDSLLNASTVESGLGDDSRGGAREPETEEEAWERREAERERSRRRRNGTGSGTGPPRWSNSSPPPAPSRRQQRTAPPSDAHAHDEPSAVSGETAQQLREQAEKALAQASEIGLNVFKTANAFWSSSKAQLAKAYEERRAATASPQTNDGRPKWARDRADEDAEAEGRAAGMSRGGGRGGFKDDSDDEEDGRPEGAAPRHRAPSSSNSNARRPSPPAAAAAAADFDLLGGGEPPNPAKLAIPAASGGAKSGYVSPHRRRPGRDAAPPPSAPSTSSRGATSSSSSSSRAPAQQQRQPTRPKRTRAVPSIPPSTLSQSHALRAQGTAAFKLGSYADAESHYSRALALISPDSHVLRVPLLNNRAAARGKIGDTKGTVEDCSAAIAIITEGSEGSKWDPASEEPITPISVSAPNGTMEQVSVDLADAWVRALQRRAQALEGMEKWGKAKEDWESLIGASWAGRVRDEAVKGVGRCRRMADDGGGSGPSGPTSAAAAKPKPRPKPAAAASRPRPTLSSSNAQDSAGVAKLRAAANTQESEELERIRLKDSVDARLLAWKGGKEANLRALIGSLDMVLWPELGWTKVGLHELVSPSQVKVRYMKAIGRVHPDKLSAMNTTVEQRMIANGVFGALNEAWNSFKP